MCAIDNPRESHRDAVAMGTRAIARVSTWQDRSSERKNTMRDKHSDIDARMRALKERTAVQRPKGLRTGKSPRQYIRIKRNARNVTY